MNTGRDWQVTLMQEDALLFKAAPDGTVSMCVMPKTEWKARLAENATGGTGQTVATVVEQIMSADGASGVHA